MATIKFLITNTLLLYSLFQTTLSSITQSSLELFPGFRLTGVKEIPYPQFEETNDGSFEIIGECTFDNKYVGKCFVIPFVDSLGIKIFEVDTSYFPSKFIKEGTVTIPFSLFKSFDTKNLPDQISLIIKNLGSSVDHVIKVDLTENINRFDELNILLNQISSYKRDLLKTVSSKVIIVNENLKAGLENSLATDEYYESLNQIAILNTKIRNITDYINTYQTNRNNLVIKGNEIKFNLDRLFSIMTDKEKLMKTCKNELANIIAELEKLEKEFASMSEEDFESYKFNKQTRVGCEFRLIVNNLKMIIPTDISKITDCIQQILKYNKVEKGRQILNQLRPYQG
jgi:hypothetical protein